MTLDEAREHIGHGVVYAPEHEHAEEGTITSVNDRFVFVRYGANRTPAATDPGALVLLSSFVRANTSPSPAEIYAPDVRACSRCRKVLVDQDELGWYYQRPVTDPEVPGLTFMDRVHECDGHPHAVIPAGRCSRPKCGRVIVRCEWWTSHAGCSSARGWIHVFSGAHACEPRSDGPYAYPMLDETTTPAAKFPAVLRTPCGTYKGWNFHNRLNEEPCQPCKDARTQYVQDWRRRTGRTKTHRVRIRPQDVDQIVARQRAVEVLIGRHKGEFHRIMAAEVARSLAVKDERDNEGSGCA